ncbi:Ankyrin repeat protein, partial [Globisporangium splendens]
MQALQRADLYGGEPLLQSAMFGSLESLEALLDEGVSIDIHGNSGATALHMASLLPQGNGAVPFLLASGAPVNAVDEFGFTPLHRFIQSQNVEGATMLLYSGANLTIAAPGGETPLHLAAYENSRELAQLLLAFGANPFARNDRGATSFEVGLFDMLVPPHHMT